MALTAFTHYSTRPRLHDFTHEPARGRPMHNNIVIISDHPEPQKMLIGFGPQKGRRLLEGAYVIMGIFLVVMGILGLLGKIAMGTPFSAVCLTVGLLFAADGLGATTIDLVRFFKRPKFKGELDHQTAAIPITVNGKPTTGKAVHKKTPEAYCFVQGTEKGVRDFFARKYAKTQSRT